MEKVSRMYRPTVILLFAIMVIFVIIIAKGFLYPIVLSILFAYLLFPISNFFENRLKIPRIISNLMTIILALFFIAAGIFILYAQLKRIMADLPTLRHHALANLDSLSNTIENKLGISDANQRNYIKEVITSSMDQRNPSFKNAFKTTTETIVRVGLMPVYIFFMLYYRDKVYEFILKISPPKNLETIKNIIREISSITKNYVGGVFLVVVCLSIMDSIGFTIIGIKYPILFGLVAAMCGIVPYFGNIVGFSIPLVFSLFMMDSSHYAVGVIICFFIVQFTENNILTPNIVGHNVNLNPFVIVLSLLAGAMIWGLPGMIVVVPFMAVFREICKNVEVLKPFAFLLGTEGTERHSLTFDKIKNLFRKHKKKYPNDLIYSD